VRRENKFEDLSIDGKKIFKWIIRKWDEPCGVA
jgi:hypothetical protein